MKTLILMRHAKATWEDKVKDDRKRPLSKRGRKYAQQMGEQLHQEKIIPEIILSSSADRARQTAELVMEELKYEGDVCFLNCLYLAEVDSLVSEIRRISNGLQSAMVIGHNPGLESVVQMMTEKVESLPTGAAALLRIPIDSWSDFHPEMQAELVHLWKPKDL